MIQQRFRLVTSMAGRKRFERWSTILTA